MVSGGAALVALSVIGLIMLTVIAARHLDSIEADDEAHRQDLIREVRREAMRQDMQDRWPR